MKTKYFILTIILLLGGFIITGCNDRDNMEDNVRIEEQTMMDERTQYENEWMQFKRDADSRINAIQTKIDDFKLAMEKTNLNFKEKYANEVLTIEQRNLQLKKELNDFNYDGNENWVEFKSKFFNDVESVENTIEEIFVNKE